MDHFNTDRKTSKALTFNEVPGLIDSPERTPSRLMDGAEESIANVNVAATVSLAGIGFDRTQVEVICDPAVADRIAARVREQFYDHYAMILFLQDVSVLRSDKF